MARARIETLNRLHHLARRSEFHRPGEFEWITRKSTFRLEAEQYEPEGNLSELSSVACCVSRRRNGGFGSRAAVAGRRMAQPVYPQLRNTPCDPALTLRARSGLVCEQYLKAVCEFSTIMKLQLGNRRKCPSIVPHNGKC
jgi:hypothetical protein